MADKKKAKTDIEPIEPNPKIHPRLMATAGLLSGHGYVGIKKLSIFHNNIVKKRRFESYPKK